MIILPAIDLMDGTPVRLYQGDYNRKEIVAASAVETAQAFAEAGAGYVHMVDLDGAKSGRRENAAVIAAAAKSISVPVEAGGGIRTMEDIDWYIENGIARVILGTAAIRDEALLKEALKKYGERIAVGMDCRDGYACASGWLETSPLHYLEFAEHLVLLGVRNIIFTDISKDGTLQGPNLEMLEQLQKRVNADITASGGIHNLEDIRNLKNLGVYGAICGKAVYSGTLDLKEAVRIGRE